MAFCNRCGAQAAPGAAFCAACGAPITDGAIVNAPPVNVAPAAPVTPPPTYAAPAAADYSLVLYSTGTCARNYADDVLEDLLGYTNAEAKQLVAMLPAQIAQYLTAEQAQYLAQALTEYGMEVAVFRGNNAVDFSQYATGSVFNTDGSFIASAVAALATVGVANRLTGFRRWSGR